MKNKMKRNKEFYDNEFNKLIDIKPRIYSMANGCYRCTVSEGDYSGVQGMIL